MDEKCTIYRLPLAIKNIPIIALAVCCLCLFTASNSVGQADEINWYPLQKAQHLARENQKKILLFAQTKWNIYCKKMRNDVFSKRAVIDSLNAYFYAAKMNIDSDSTMRYQGKEWTPKKFARTYKIHATPTTFFLSADGKMLGQQPGFMSSKMFSQLLGFIGSGAYQHVEFKTYLKQHTSAR